MRLDDGVLWSIASRIALRKPTLEYFKELFPKMPEYVVRDYIYKNFKNTNSKYEVEDLVTLFADYDWEFKVINVSMDSFNEDTRDQLEERMRGQTSPKIPKDLERHETQKKLLEKIPSSEVLVQEPIIVRIDYDGYDLMEGWHRVIQALLSHPEGFRANAWIGSGS